MKALAALHNQLAISQLIFHPAVVMSSARARAQYIIPRCYDKPRPPGARGGIWTLLGPRVKSLPFVAEIMAAGLLVDGQWNKGWRQTTNRSGGHLNKTWRGEGGGGMDGFIASQMPPSCIAAPSGCVFSSACSPLRIMRSINQMARSHVIVNMYLWTITALCCHCDVCVILSHKL